MMRSRNRNPVFTEEIRGPSAWVSSDFTDSSQWTISLDEYDAIELIDAVRYAKSTGKPIDAIAKHDFPLKNLVHKLKGVTDELTTGRGFAVIRNFPLDSDISRDDVELMYWGFCSHLGRAVSQNGLGHVIVPVRNYGAGTLSNASVRGYQTSGALRFHTDSSDIVGLLCLESSGEGGLSSISSSMSIHNELLRNHRELLGLLYAGFYYDRRDEEPLGERPYYRNAVYAQHDGRISCRYYLRDFVTSANDRFGLDLSEVENYALDAFEEAANLSRLKISMQLRRGDLQFLNNNVIVHARTAYADSSKVSRELLRIWLNPYDLPAPPGHLATFRNGMPGPQPSEK